jgi:hypothetical protein
MESKNKLVYFLVFLLMYLAPIKSNSQIKIITKPQYLFVSDTLKINIHNSSQKAKYYYCSWEIFEKGKWRLVRHDIWSDDPMSEKWNKIIANGSEERMFVINNIFTGIYKKYKRLPSRLVVRYSYSEKIDLIKMIYSNKFTVLAKK